MFKEYTKERDIPDSIWNQYLCKYDLKYKIRIQEDNIRAIICKYGIIELYSLKEGILLFCGIFPTKQKLSYLLKKLPNFVDIISEGEGECVIIFPETKLAELESILKIKKRRRISSKTRQQLRERMKILNTEKGEK